MAEHRYRQMILALTGRAWVSAGAGKRNFWLMTVDVGFLIDFEAAQSCVMNPARKSICMPSIAENVKQSLMKMFRDLNLTRILWWLLHTQSNGTKNTKFRIFSDQNARHGKNLLVGLDNLRWITFFLSPQIQGWRLHVQPWILRLVTRRNTRLPCKVWR